MKKVLLKSACVLCSRHFDFETAFHAILQKGGRHLVQENQKIMFLGITIDTHPGPSSPLRNFKFSLPYNKDSLSHLQNSRMCLQLLQKKIHFTYKK